MSSRPGYPRTRSGTPRHWRSLSHNAGRRPARPDRAGGESASRNIVSRALPRRRDGRFGPDRRARWLVAGLLHQPRALQVVLAGAEASGADVQLFSVRDLNLPLYNSDREVPALAAEFAETVYACDAMVWSTPITTGRLAARSRTRWTGWSFWPSAILPIFRTSPSVSSPRLGVRKGCRPSTRWISSPGRCEVGACPWSCR